MFVCINRAISKFSSHSSDWIKPLIINITIFWSRNKSKSGCGWQKKEKEKKKLQKFLFDGEKMLRLGEELIFHILMAVQKKLAKLIAA